MTFYETTRQKISADLALETSRFLKTNPPSDVQYKIFELLKPSKDLKFGDFTAKLPQVAALFSCTVPVMISALQEKWQYIPPHLNYHMDPTSLRTTAFLELSKTCRLRNPSQPKLPIHRQFHELLSALEYTPSQAASLAQELTEDQLHLLFQAPTEINLIRALLRHTAGADPSFSEETSQKFYQTNMVLDKEATITQSRIALVGITLMLL